MDDDAEAHAMYEAARTAAYEAELRRPRTHGAGHGNGSGGGGGGDDDDDDDESLGSDVEDFLRSQVFFTHSKQSRAFPATDTRIPRWDEEESTDAVACEELEAPVPSKLAPAVIARPTATPDRASSPVPPRSASRGRYYLELELTCYNCGKQGHRAQDCGEAKKERPCYLCGQWGHRPINCLEGFCFKCGEVGHHAKECPSANKNAKCEHCLSRTHFTKHCPTFWRQYKLATVKTNEPMSVRQWCYNCAQQGHFGDNCRKTRLEPIPAITAFRLERDDADINSDYKEDMPSRFATKHAQGKTPQSQKRGPTIKSSPGHAAAKSAPRWKRVTASTAKPLASVASKKRKK